MTELDIEEDSGRREQSSIVFPYLDLETAIEVAKAVYNRNGLGVCELDELAAELGQTVSGAFRAKTGTARIFELISKEGKNAVKLTALGRGILAAESERGARAEAFLSVPLYRQIYENYRGHHLPPAKALEREMANLGVASKQTDRARQAFERSARQAGFFDTGEGRLVKPKTEGNSLDAPKEEKASSSVEQSANDKPTINMGSGSYHPFVQGLLQTLPAPETEWPISDRQKWLQTAASIFGLIYKGEGTLRVTSDDT